MEDQHIIEGLDSFLKKVGGFLTGKKGPDETKSLFNVGGRVSSGSDPVADMYSSEALKSSLLSTYSKLDDILETIKQMGGDVESAKSSVSDVITFIQDSYRKLSGIIDDPKDYTAGERSRALNSISDQLNSYTKSGGKIDKWRQEWLGKDNTALVGYEYFKKGKDLVEKANQIFSELERSDELRDAIKNMEVSSVFKRAKQTLLGGEADDSDKPQKPTSKKQEKPKEGEKTGKTKKVSTQEPQKSSNPPIKDSGGSDPKFFTVPSLKLNLEKIAQSVKITLRRNKGLGKSFDMDKYKSLKKKSSVYWAVFDISANKLIANSENADKNIYAASVSKAVVSAAALSNNGGKLPNDSDYGKMIKLLVPSDNTVWDSVQKLAGGSDAVNKFSSQMGYNMKPARRGGNNINAVGMCKFWRDVIRGNFKGADIIYKISSSCSTDSNRGRKCIPTSSYMGGKTGTYKEWNHSSGWVKVGEKFYSITVLTDKNSGSEAVATMFGGLFKEYIGK